MSHFKLVSSTKASDIIPVNKYVSGKTGITVIIAEVEGPVVNGFFCFATEAHDDDGLPHTLEHLIFLGSHRYPYKGILDLLANRCMAHGTNAWTDTDHTCYTINTAGDAGMLTLIPIYLDHILNPTLSDEGFITEVHHVDGDGEDVGVVYCEMQGRENSADSRCELKLLREMYPDSGYSAETGGIMENLRTSTDNVKVKAFHKKFYRPENLTVILTGQINAQDVFKELAVVEEDIIEKRKQETLEKWVKPWQVIPPSPKFGEYNVQWPADTEDCGQILFGWRGPLLLDSTSTMEVTGCAVLLRYLCDTASAPLQKCLVEREDALAGDVSYNLTENMSVLIKIQLDNVPVGRLATARDEARACLAAVRSGQELLDMNRMRILLRKQLRESLASLESDPHNAVAFRCIGDALYSQNGDDFVSRMNPEHSLQELLKMDADYWLDLLRKYFSEETVTIVGSPSIQLQTRMAEDEKNRIELQREKLGEDGLATKAKQLDDAIEFNERPPPPGTLASVPVPSCKEFKRYAITTWSTDKENCPNFDLKRIPIYTRAHSLTTQFVYISLILDTSKVDEKTRKWIPLHLNGLAECPVRRGDELISHEDVISTTEQLTVSFHNNIGFNKTGNFTVGNFGNFLHIETKCEPADYEKVVNLLYEVLFAPEFTKERLLVFAQRMINDVANVRRNGNKMVHDIVRDSIYKKDTNTHWGTVLRQQQFLKDLIEQLNSESRASDALNDANVTFKNITKNLWLNISADFSRNKLSTEPWRRFSRDTMITPSPPQLYWDADYIDTTSGRGGCVVGGGGVESSFVVQYSPGPLGYAARQLAALMLAINYFTQLEGPMWRLIRGCGLSYGYAIRPSLSEGRLAFYLYRATNAIVAYTKAKSIIEEFSKDGKEFDKDLFDSARSTTIFEVVEEEKCPADVVAQSLLMYLYRGDMSFRSELVKAILEVEPKEVHEAAAKWLQGMFDVEQTQIGIVCHPSKVNDIQAAFSKINVQLDAYVSMEDSHFNK